MEIKYYATNVGWEDLVLFIVACIVVAWMLKIELFRISEDIEEEKKDSNFDD